MPTYVKFKELPAKGDAILCAGHRHDIRVSQNPHDGRMLVSMPVFADLGRGVPLPTEALAAHAQQLIELAHQRPELTIYVPRGLFLWAGLDDRTAASLFGLAPANIKVSECWRPYIEDIRT